MRKTIVIATGFALLLPGMVLAGHQDHHSCHHSKHQRKIEHHVNKARQHLHKARHHERQVHHQVRQERSYGRVLSVEPVYAVSHHQEPAGSCISWREPATHGESWTPTLLGGVIGAAVGYSLGEDHGDPEVATIAASLLGASVGRDIGQHLQRSGQLQVRGPCTPQHRQRPRPEPLEYVVTYRYNGQVYRKRMDYDPGEWVALNVEVSPA